MTRRVRARVEGVVQGVGYRPFVYRLAGELGVDGWVLNDSRGVLVEAEGEGRDRRLRGPAGQRRAAAGLGGARRARGCRPGRGRRVPDPGQRHRGARRADRRGRGRVRGLPGRGAGSRRPAPRLPVRQLHQLRAAVHHRHARALRQAGDHDGRLPDVRRLPGRVRRPRRPPLPRATQRVPGLRPAAVAPAGGGGDGAGRRADRGGQGPGRLPPGLPRRPRAGRRRPPRAQAPRGQAVRADDAGPPGRRRARGPHAGGAGAHGRARTADRDRPPAPRMPRWHRRWPRARRTWA